MSTKNIALDSKVYSRLASTRRESESFSKAVSRLLEEVQGSHTGRDVLARLADISPLTDDEAKRMLKVVEDARQREGWEPHDLR
jgi:predicted CopG family antitoxin